MEIAYRNNNDYYSKILSLKKNKQIKNHPLDKFIIISDNDIILGIVKKGIYPLETWFLNKDIESLFRRNS